MTHHGQIKWVERKNMLKSFSDKEKRELLENIGLIFGQAENNRTKLAEIHSLGQILLSNQVIERNERIEKLNSIELLSKAAVVLSAVSLIINLVSLFKKK